MFIKDGTPEFIQRLFTNLGGSKTTSINCWIAIRDMLQYMIDFNRWGEQTYKNKKEPDYVSRT